MALCSDGPTVQRVPLGALLHRDHQRRVVEPEANACMVWLPLNWTGLASALQLYGGVACVAFHACGGMVYVVRAPSKSVSTGTILGWTSTFRNGSQCGFAQPNMPPMSNRPVLPSPFNGTDCLP